MTSVVEERTQEPASPATEASAPVSQLESNVPSNPESLRRRRRPPLLPAVRPEPTHAYGFIILEECAERYAKKILASSSKYAPGTKDYDCAVRCMTRFALRKLPAHIHSKIPTLPTPHPLPLLVQGSLYFVYPLADNHQQNSAREVTPCEVSEGEAPLTINDKTFRSFATHENGLQGLSMHRTAYQH
ncbi:hypothetical protein K474DRAFT_1664792 [Panus rudis PR-1116 ss-1]|nr:hypothetical protein K474DRAFT_1664792 [Panus rudis PR-1116 ss-1]